MLIEINSPKANRFSGKKIIVLFLFMTAYIFSQSWNSTITTSISEPNAVKMDLFTNREGNHLIVQNSNALNSLKYYLLNSSGSIVRSTTIETSGGTEFPNISGDNDKVYVVYKIGNNLRLKKSTNAGSSWGNTVNQSVGNNTCNGVDIVYDYRGLHVVYAMKDNGSEYETYYQLVSNDQWGSIEDVTGYGSEVGGFPTIAVSSNRIHVGYNTGNIEDPFWNLYENAKTRDKYNTTWQTPQSVTSGGAEESAREKVQVRTDKLYNFFYDFWCDTSPCGYELKVKSRDLDETSWSSPTTLNSVNNPAQFMGAEQTANNELHIVYGDWGIFHRYYNGTSWSQPPYELTNLLELGVTFGFSYSSNDLYCVWKEREINNFKYAQYDATPLAPTNLTSYLDSDPNCFDCHEGSGSAIGLDWDKNNEPDLNYYTIYRAEEPGNCSSCHGSSGGTPEDSMSAFIEPVTVEQDCPALSDEITDFTKASVEVETGCQSGLESTQKLTYEPIWAWPQNWWIDMFNIQEDYTYFYFVKATDVANQESDPSNSTDIYVPVGGLNKPFSNFSGEVIPKIFFLYQNYPNPFNPSTTIHYQVPEDTYVKIEVFNSLGQKVKTLVNEFKTEGYYSVTWEGEDDFKQPLASGIYIYKMTTQKFVQAEKMILLR